MKLANRLAWGHRIAMPVYHIAAIALMFIYPLTPKTLVLFLITYLIQALGISVGYHRLFSHRAFHANRILTFLLALCGGLAGQGAIRRWVCHHRMHHRYTDKTGDPHSPLASGFWYAHIGWRFDPESYVHEEEAKKIWAEWPAELCWLDRMIPTLFFLHPLVLGLVGGWEYVEWGCFVPTVLLWEITFTVNSISHRFGRRLFDTPDTSRNSTWLSLMMWGEGWHNNHHASPKNARYGIRWYQIDAGYYFIKIMQRLGLIDRVVDDSEADIRNALAMSLAVKPTTQTPPFRDPF